ncbi:hypothetical protein BCON_0280g00050 [Botryotinia convoluta]|uniref:Piwi domain-containing protein n=1 Tax=Botryotinia convoluta TaxID=54673 RepID=A0A4Z1HDW9_9HELO|nr:hypothetical protein BCON_0280g00050 [Botryotinia convoluta]
MRTSSYQQLVHRRTTPVNVEDRDANLPDPVQANYFKVTFNSDLDLRRYKIKLDQINSKDVIKRATVEVLHHRLGRDQTLVPMRSLIIYEGPFQRDALDTHVSLSNSTFVPDADLRMLNIISWFRINGYNPQNAPFFDGFRVGNRFYPTVGGVIPSRQVPSDGDPIFLIRTGFYTSMRPAIGSVLLNVNTVTSAFFPPEILSAWIWLRWQQEIPPVNEQNNLVGLRVTFSGDGPSPKTRVIRDVSSLNVSQVNFTPPDADGTPGQVTSVYDHMRNKVEKFAQDLRKKIRDYGVTFTGNESISDAAFSPNRLPFCIGLDAALTALRARNGSRNPRLLLVVVPDKNIRTYANIKWWGDCVAGIPTICITRGVLTKGRHTKQGFKSDIGVISNISLKINFKLGGVSHFLNDKASQRIFWAGAKANTMIVGADVSHAGKGRDTTCPSMAGVVATCDQQCSQYFASARLQENNTESIADLADMIGERLDKYYIVNKVLPEHILFYRNGSHDSALGTARSAHYIVIINESDYTPERIQETTNTICFTGSRAFKALSVCTPAKYADILCDRMRCYMKPALDNDFAATSPNNLNFYRTNTNIWNVPRQNRTNPWHSNLNNLMFYL